MMAVMTYSSDQQTDTGTRDGLAGLCSNAARPHTVSVAPTYCGWRMPRLNGKPDTCVAMRVSAYEGGKDSTGRQ